MSRGIEQIVNDRVLTWEAERRSAPPPPPSGVQQPLPAQKPLICISRQCGSRGGELGRLVAERLSFGFYSQELVHEIATAAHVQSGAVETFDEQVGLGVVAAGPERYPFHCTQIADGSRTIPAGVAVQFRVDLGPNGLEAVAVVPCDPSAPT